MIFDRADVRWNVAPSHLKIHHVALISNKDISPYSTEERLHGKLGQQKKFYVASYLDNTPLFKLNFTEIPTETQGKFRGYVCNMYIICK